MDLAELGWFTADHAMHWLGPAVENLDGLLRVAREVHPLHVVHLKGLLSPSELLVDLVPDQPGIRASTETL